MDPVVGEEAGRLDQEQGCGGGRLVGEDLAEGDPGAVIDGRVDVVVANAPAPCCLDPAMGAVTAAIRDAAQLLYVDVNQFAGVLALVADHHPTGPVDVSEAILAMAAQDAIDGRGRHVQPPGQAMRALAVAAAGGQDPTRLGGGEGMRAAVGRELRSARPAEPC